MRPYDITHTDQLYDMESDNFPPDPERWSIMHNGDNVSIHGPADNPGWIAIPREQFNELIDWYLADQPDARAALSSQKEG